MWTSAACAPSHPFLLAFPFQGVSISNPLVQAHRIPSRLTAQGGENLCARRAGISQECAGKIDLECPRLPHCNRELRVCGAGVIRAQAAACGGGEAEVRVELRTCRNCKKMYNPLENHPRACRFHSAHFGGESVRSGFYLANGFKP